MPIHVHTHDTAGPNDRPLLPITLHPPCLAVHADGVVVADERPCLGSHALIGLVASPHVSMAAGTGVASMIACAESGADAVDACCDAMAGLTSQPHMGAIIHEFHGTPLDTGIELEQMMHLNTYWEGARGLYAPFETGQKSAGADVYINEIPGGQYTNLQFQALSMGQADRWPAIKNAYAEANQMFGDIIKVTPSSKVAASLRKGLRRGGTAWGP